MTGLRVGASVRELVPGDPDAVGSLAARLGSLAGGLGQAAAQIRLVEAGDWIGPAAEAFDDVIDLEPARYETAASAFGRVAGALHRFVGVLRQAQESAQLAIDVFEEAAAATDRWTGARHRYDGVRRSAEAGVATSMALLDGLVAPPADDPGSADRARAEALLVEARLQVWEAGAEAAAIIDDAGAGAPDEPSLAERAIGAVGAAGRAVREFAGGVWESSRDLGVLVWNTSNLRFVLDPDGWRRDIDELAGAVVYGIEHPAAVVRTATDYETWLESPFRAWGHLAPDAVIALATAGAGAGGTVVRRMATTAATVARLEREWHESEARLVAAVDHSVDVFAITPEPVWRTTDEPLYRADDRSPEVIFEAGFVPRNPGNVDLALFVLTGQPSAFVSTTHDADLILESPSEYQYEIDAPGGIDVNATIGPHPFDDEQEIAFPGGIEACSVEGARPYDPGTGQLGPVVSNPEYDPACND